MKKILFLSALCITLMGCEKYLDKIEESTGMTGEDVFTNYLNFRQFEDRMYKDIHNYLDPADYGPISSLSDEGYITCEWETMPVIQSGDWLRAYSLGQALQFYKVWGSWESIRIANISLENLNQMEGIATQEEIDQLKGQAHFMRAWYYYEFLKRQGGMPYITKSFKGTDNFALARLSYHETALKVAADCDTAISFLPERWDVANMGRPTKGAAMAVKSAVLLFSASPTNNPDNDQTRWDLAARASWDLINYAESTGNYKLLECKGTDNITYAIPSGNVAIPPTIESISYPSGFDSIFLYQPYNDEIIWEYWGFINNTGIYRPFTVPSLNAGGVIHGYSPTANIVDMFETNNGLAIEDDPVYDEQDPYVNRDPRFYHSILFNGERWTSKTDRYLELFNGGTERQPVQYYSLTGYLARKYWYKNVDQWSPPSGTYTHSIFFRLAGIYLQYAEACNEIGGPDYSLDGANLTAVEAVNRVRERVKMPPVNSIYLTNKDVFRERIKNERAVELFLEGHRFFDLSRWGDAHKAEHRQLYAVDIYPDPSKPTGYVFTHPTEPFFVLTFTQKHYRWPVPLEDALMFEEFKQNPGW
jgi:hypothetical protein